MNKQKRNNSTLNFLFAIMMTISFGIGLASCKVEETPQSVKCENEETNMTSCTQEGGEWVSADCTCKF